MIKKLYDKCVTWAGYKYAKLALAIRDLLYIYVDTSYSSYYYGCRPGGSHGGRSPAGRGLRGVGGLGEASVSPPPAGAAPLPLG